MDTKEQMHLVGYSDDFNICDGRSSVPGMAGSGETIRCHNFVNKSSQTLCERHQMERK